MASDSVREQAKGQSRRQLMAGRFDRPYPAPRVGEPYVLQNRANLQSRASFEANYNSVRPVRETRWKYIPSDESWSSFQYFRNTDKPFLVSLLMPFLNGNREIPPDVVEEISLSPSEEIRFSILALPKSVFKKTRDEDTPIEIYSNQKYGLEIEVLNGVVNNITFMIPQRTRIKCDGK